MFIKRAASLVIIFTMLSGGLTIFSLPIVSASAPSSPIGSASYINASLSGFQNLGTYASGSAHIVPVEASSPQYVNENVGTGTQWSKSGTTSTYTIDLGSFQRYSDTPFNFYFTFELVSTAPGTSLGYVYSNLTYFSSVYSYSYNFNYNTATGSVIWVENAITWNPSSYQGYGDASLTVAAAGQVSGTYGEVYGFMTMSSASNQVVSSQPAQAASPFMTGWTYSGVTTGTGTISQPSGIQAAQFSYTSPYALEVSGGGQTSSQATGNTLTFSASPPNSMTFQDVLSDPNVYGFSISWNTPNVIQIAPDTISNSTGVSYSLTENQNWWNGTFSAKFTPPSAWLNGASLDGKTWGTTASYTVQHVLFTDTSAPVTFMNYSGSLSGTVSPIQQYNSWSGGVSSADSAFTLTFNVHEFLNYRPHIPGLPSTTFQSGSTVSLSLTTSEDITGEKETVNVQWEDGATSSVLNHQFGPYSFTHEYRAVGTYSILVTVTNQPNGDPVSPSALSNSSSALYIITIDPNPSPSANLPLANDQAIYLNWSQSNVVISAVQLTVNGIGVAPVQHSSTSYSYLSPSAGITTINAVWTLSGGSLSYVYDISYAGKLIPSEYSRSVSVLFSDNTTHSYPITLSGVPSGSGYYQQLITINNPSQYGINSAGSNIQFAAPNGTLLYAWEQSVNSSAIQVWIKNYNGSSTIDMQVFPQFENLFSANGYLGSNSSDNMRLVFGNELKAFSSNADGYTASYGAGSSIIAHNGLYENMSNTWNTYIRSNLTLPSNLTVLSMFYGTYPPTSNSDAGASVILTSSTTIGNNSYALTQWQPGNGQRDFGVVYGYNNGGNNPSFPWTDTKGTVESFNPSQYYTTTISLNNGYLDYAEIDGQSLNAVDTTDQVLNPYIALQQTQLTGYWAYVVIIPMSHTEMPTASISGTGQVFMANSTQINHPNYQSMAPTGSNLSAGYYQYYVPDYYNSAYATVFYNASWEFYSASPQTWVLGTSGGMDWIFFNDLTGSGTVSFVLREPIRIANPVGTMSVTYTPSSAVNGLALFNLPTSLLTLKANDVEVNPSGFPVIVGKPVTLQVLTSSGSLVCNKTITPASLQDYEALLVNVSSITFMNENMSQVVSVSVSSGNVTQDLAPIMPLETSTVYIPSGSYTWTFQSLNLTTGAVIHSLTASSTLNGLDWQIFTGLTFLDVKNTEIQQSNNISSVLRTVNIDVLAGQNTTLIVNTTVNALNGSFKNLNLNETTFFDALNSTMNSSNVTITSDVAIVNSLVKGLNVQMLQSFAQVYGATGQVYEIYSLLKALNNYLISHGSGITAPQANEQAASFTSMIDPLEVIQGSSYANDTTNLSANYTNFWISNPINETAFSSILASTIHSQLTLNEIGSGSAYKVAVNYYTLKSGALSLVHTDWYNNSAQLVQLIPSYIADGYVVDLNFSGYTHVTGQEMDFQEYTTWSGSMNFDWTLNNNTKTYSDSFSVPGEQGFWNDILMASVQAIPNSQEFNMSSVMQNVIMGFPPSVTVNPASITLKDLTDGTNLIEGSNFYGSGTGLQFTTFNDTEHRFFATFQPVQNVTVGNTIPLSLGAPTQTYLGQKEVYLAGALYINTGGIQTSNFILSVTQSQNIENATVMVNGQIWPSNEVSIVGNQVVVDNVHMTPGESVSIKVYYSLSAPLTVYSALFFPLISGLTWLTPWFFVGVSLLVVLGVVVRNRKGKKETLYRGELGIIFLGFLVWFIVMMMHLQGAI